VFGDKLIDQIAIGGMDLDTVKTGTDGIFCRLSIQAL